MTFDSRLHDQIAEHPFPLLFVTISGAHLYGFPSEDSDYDLRGVHLLPMADCLGLETGTETVDRTDVRDGLEVDLVTHDAKKFFGLMLKNNGYVMEQVLSPLVMLTTPEHEELRAIAKECVTRYHAHHYLGFAASQWKLFRKEDPPRVKPLLYLYRVLLTGIHLMRTGEVEANLVTLNESFQLPGLSDLIAAKTGGAEKETVVVDLPHQEREYQRLIGELEQAHENSSLREKPTGAAALNDLLIRLRVQSGKADGLL